MGPPSAIQKKGMINSHPYLKKNFSTFPSEVDTIIFRVYLYIGSQGAVYKRLKGSSQVAIVLRVPPITVTFKFIFFLIWKIHFLYCKK